MKNKSIGKYYGNITLTLNLQYKTWKNIEKNTTYDRIRKNKGNKGESHAKL